MKSFCVLNYHITNECNYDCLCCFGKFPGQSYLSLEKAKRIISSIRDYFEQNGIGNGRINFAGGEPLTYPFLDELIDYAYSLGITVSVITNGSLLTSERIRSWEGKVSCIGISIDSLKKETNIVLGRCNVATKVVSPEQWPKLAETIRQCNMKLKVNILVSSMNLEEDFLPLLTILKPDRVKLLQMHLVNGINDRAKKLTITKDQFNRFCDKYIDLVSNLVIEAEGEMENSYLMINPEGKLQINHQGNYQEYGDCDLLPLSDILKNVPIDSTKYSARYSKEGSR